jgi:hypothetical protein
MKNEQKIIEALYDLLHDRKDVNKNSLCQRAGVHRIQLDRMIKKHKDFIDVEVIEND